MTEVDLADYLRNDPVPRLLWLAGQNDPAAPRRILSAAGIEAGARRDWRMLADTFAGGQLRAGPNLIANSSFTSLRKHAPEPGFLYAKFGPVHKRLQRGRITFTN